MKPLVSILIPAYNAEKWLRDTIQSALSQTWPKKELIIVDDGSSDNTLKIAREFESKRVKVITQKNIGACNARNRALSVSQGDFIQWLDADDLLDPGKITLQLANNDSSAETRTLYSCAWGRFYFRPQKAKFNPDPLWQDLSPLKWLVSSFGEGCMMPCSAWLVSRKLTDMAGPWDERLTLNDDGEYFCRVVSASERVKFISKARCYYRKGNFGSISFNWSKNALESLSLSLNLCIDHLLALENDENTKRVCISLLQKFINSHYPADAEIINNIQKRIVELGGTVSSPKESRKFYFVRKIFGWKTSRFFKKWLWELEVGLYKNWDQLLAKLSRNSNINST
jgi:glycosyltransferase involved in cell wall biosynthesis